MAMQVTTNGNVSRDELFNIGMLLMVAGVPVVKTTEDLSELITRLMFLRLMPTHSDQRPVSEYELATSLRAVMPITSNVSKRIRAAIMSAAFNSQLSDVRTIATKATNDLADSI